MKFDLEFSNEEKHQQNISKSNKHTEKAPKLANPCTNAQSEEHLKTKQKREPNNHTNLKKQRIPQLTGDNGVEPIGNLLLRLQPHPTRHPQPHQELGHHRKRKVPGALLTADDGNLRPPIQPHHLEMNQPVSPLVRHRHLLPPRKSHRLPAATEEPPDTRRRTAAGEEEGEEEEEGARTLVGEKSGILKRRWGVSAVYIIWVLMLPGFDLRWLTLRDTNVNYFFFDMKP